jgi:hypothetical protein
MNRSRVSVIVLVPAALLVIWAVALAQDGFLRGLVTGGGTASSGDTYTLTGVTGESFAGGEGNVQAGLIRIIAALQARTNDPGGQPVRQAGYLSGEIQGDRVALTYILLDGSPATLTLAVSADGRTLTGKGLLPTGDVSLSMKRDSGSLSDLSGTYTVDFGGDALVFALVQSGTSLTGSGGPHDPGDPESPPQGLLVAKGSFDGRTVTLSAVVEEGPLTLTLKLSADGTSLSGRAQLAFGQIPFTFNLKTRTGPNPLDGIWEAFNEGELITLDLTQVGSQIRTRVPGAIPRLPAPIALELGYLLYLFDQGEDRNGDGRIDVNDFVLSLGALGGAAEPSSGAGRVRVALPPLSPGEAGFWSRLVASSEGGTGGFYLPEVEDEVLVAFLSSDTSLPAILGQTYNGTDAPATTDVGGRVVGRGKVELFDAASRSFLLKDLSGETDDVRVVIGEAAAILTAELSAEAFTEGSPWQVVAEDGAYWESLAFDAGGFESEALDVESLADCDWVVVIGERASPVIIAQGIVGIRNSVSEPDPDFDGDGSVGFSDFLSFAGAFGKIQSDPDFDARFDLDGDGTVGFSDFLTFAKAFGG